MTGAVVTGAATVLSGGKINVPWISYPNPVPKVNGAGVAPLKLPQILVPAASQITGTLLATELN